MPGLVKKRQTNHRVLCSRLDELLLGTFSGITPSKSYIGYEVRIGQGKGTYGIDGVRILAYGGSEKLVVGNFSSIGPGVSILLGGEHRYGWTSTFPVPGVRPSSRGSDAEARFI